MRPEKALDLVLKHTQNYRFYQDIPDDLIGQFASLWKRFDWTEEQVANYAQLLTDQKKRNPSDRTLWNVGLVNRQGLLQAAATAELFSLQEMNREQVHFVELTEWASNVTGQGLMQAAAAHLIAQILNDKGDQNLMIYAETNTANGAPKVGRYIGLDFLSKHPHNESNVGVLFAHVPVNDGRREIKNAYRDFSWMGLSQEARRKYYSERDVQQIVSIT